MRWSFFFFNDTATTEIYTLSLHDALPIYRAGHAVAVRDLLVEDPHADRALLEDLVADQQVLVVGEALHRLAHALHELGDRKSTRLNSSHANISYAVFCLKKKKCQHTHVNP